MSLFLLFRNKTISKLKNTILGKAILSIIEKPKKGIIHIISASRHSEAAFWSHSALGQSLISVNNRPDIKLHIHYENKIGLSAIYNQHISRENKKNLLVFVHDDVWFDTETWLDDIRAGLGRFDVIGVAGNRRLLPSHPAWLFHTVNSQGFHWDSAFLSGEVGHGKNRNGSRMHYGHFPMECQALDGVLLAAQCSKLLQAKVRFDERFSFHFYDLDFCRSATSKRLILGTWGIKITHQSMGVFGSPTWQEGYQIYLNKWN